MMEDLLFNMVLAFFAGVGLLTTGLLAAVWLVPELRQLAIWLLLWLLL